MSRSNVVASSPTPLEVAVRKAIEALSTHREHGSVQCPAERKVREGQHPCVWLDRITYARSASRIPVEMLLAIPEAMAFEIRAACGDLPNYADLPSISQDETEAESATNPLQHKAAATPHAMTEAEWDALELRVIREKARTEDHLAAIKQYRRDQRQQRDDALHRLATQHG